MSQLVLFSPLSSSPLVNIWWLSWVMSLHTLRILQGTKEGTQYPSMNMTESTCYTVMTVEVMPVQMTFYAGFGILAFWKPWNGRSHTTPVTSHDQCSTENNFVLRERCSLGQWSHGLALGFYEPKIQCLSLNRS